MLYFAVFLIFIISYLFGSIPWAFIIGKVNGIDIRKHGSGNVGATNVTRGLGKKWGVLCFILDFLKGFLPVLMVKLFFHEYYFIFKFSVDYYLIVALLGSLIGHIYPIFLYFKGGKGVSTGTGAVLVIAPYSVIIGFIIWYMVFKFLRYVSLASILASISIPITYFIFHRYILYSFSLRIEIFFIILALFVVYKHKSNIIRMLNGAENRFEKDKS